MGLFSKKNDKPNVQQENSAATEESHHFHVHNGGNGMGDWWITETGISDATGKKAIPFSEMTDTKFSSEGLLTRGLQIYVDSKMTPFAVLQKKEIETAKSIYSYICENAPAVKRKKEREFRELEKKYANTPLPPLTRTSSSSGTKTIVRNAVKGGIIAGPAGAVVGAIVGKNKVDESQYKK